MKNRDRQSRQHLSATTESVAGSGITQPAGSAATVSYGSAPPAAPDAYAAVARHWKPVLGAAVIGMIVVWLLTALQPDRYRATLLAAVAPLSETLNSTDVLRGVEVLEQRTVVATVAALAATPATMQPALQSENVDYSVDASVLPNTNLVRIDVEGADAARATAIANRLPAVLDQHTRNMFKLYGVKPVSSAIQPTEPISSGSGRAIPAGLLIGFLIGAAIAIVIEKSRRSPATAFHAS